MDLRIIIIRKLFRHRVIGGKHTAIENLTKGIPSNLRGQAKEVAKELIKEGLLLTKPAAYGLQVSLNPERLSEIIKLLEENK